MYLFDISNIPAALSAGYDAYFKGAFVKYASITLPSKYFNSVDQGKLRVAGYNMLIGNTGFSGRVALEYTDSTSSVGDDFMDVNIGNWVVDFNHFGLAFNQNVITNSFMGGRITIPKLQDNRGNDAEVYGNRHLLVKNYILTTHPSVERLPWLESIPVEFESVKEAVETA